MFLLTIGEIACNRFGLYLLTASNYEGNTSCVLNEIVPVPKTNFMVGAYFNVGYTKTNNKPTFFMHKGIGSGGYNWMLLSLTCLYRDRYDPGSSYMTYNSPSRASYFSWYINNQKGFVQK